MIQIRPFGRHIRQALLAAILGAVSLGLPSMAQAQDYGMDMVRPVEILNYLYDNGYSNARQPRLRGDVYVVLATDFRGRRVRLVIDAFEGRLLDRRIMGRDRTVITNLDRDVIETPDGVVGPDILDEPPLLSDDTAPSSVEIDTPKPKPASKPKVAEPAKPKSKKPKVAALAPQETGPLVAPGAKPPKKKPVPVVSSLPARVDPPAAPLAKPVTPPKLKPALTGVTATPPAASSKDKAVPPRLVEPAIKPRVVYGPAMPATKPKPRVIPITAPAELDAPALPKPPPLRAPTLAPVVGLD